MPVASVSRPHQLTLRSTKAGVQYLVVEELTGEVPGRGVLSPRDKPVVINVKGPTELRSNFIEHLRIEIDGVPFPLPSYLKGAVPVRLPDLPTTPPKPVPAAKRR